MARGGVGINKMRVVEVFVCEAKILPRNLIVPIFVVTELPMRESIPADGECEFRAPHCITSDCREKPSV